VIKLQLPSPAAMLPCPKFVEFGLEALLTEIRRLVPGSVVLGLESDEQLVESKFVARIWVDGSAVEVLNKDGPANAGFLKYCCHYKGPLQSLAVHTAYTAIFSEKSPESRQEAVKLALMVSVVSLAVSNLIKPTSFAWVEAQHLVPVELLERSMAVWFADNSCLPALLWTGCFFIRGEPEGLHSVGLHAFGRPEFVLLPPPVKFTELMAHLSSIALMLLASDNGLPSQIELTPKYAVEFLSTGSSLQEPAYMLTAVAG
jgi:hypothetical protein